ncbi:hypothetical protein [Chondromyces apiculatus]|uniref:N-acetyltransferase domain-containing protein n=1 Tax=Chondromyces apiculatus DSM 436 TaxID=1192034 RepID=A0A017T1F7_9BACT|nr:hypothetical protein [Chondromyces apiculatus]EYF03069.1 Hypothetical protein CAP_6183 [Chondromyces apiculatus DSM 436]
MRTSDCDLLAAVPDLTGIAESTAWFEEKRETLRSFVASPTVLASFKPMQVRDVLGAPAAPFGRYTDAAWRKTVLAVLLADWACYAMPGDQVSFARLVQVLEVFPAGFRLWWAEVPGAGWLPVGYTGWFPIQEVTFETLVSRAGELRDRTLTVLPVVDPEGSFVYLFNYSIVEPLRKTPCARRLLRALAEDLEHISLRGLAAITVSEDGIRVAERFGMGRSGVIWVAGAPDQVFTRRMR